jgi:hypothetical protein
MKVQIEAWKDGKTLQLFLYPDEAAYEVLKNHLNADFQSRKIVVTFESGDGTLVAKMYTFFIELQKLIGGHDDEWGWIRNFEITQTDITAIRE